MHWLFIKNVLGASLTFIIYAIFLKSEKHQYPDKDNLSLHCGIATKSALQSKFHWEYAQKFAIQLLYVLSGVALVINFFNYALFSNNIISDIAYNTIDGFGYISFIIAFFLIFENKIKKLQISVAL